MNKLNFEQMEEVNGGYGYCQLICHWMSGGEGYQGSLHDLIAAWEANCQPYCPHVSIIN
jgi:hypothetical protein